MILTIKFMGGLGNQMFQYSFAHLLKSENDNINMVFDIREYEKYYWPFTLNDFQLEAHTILNKKKIKQDRFIKNYHIYQKIYKTIHRIRPNFYRKKDFDRGCIFCGTYGPYVPILNERKDYFIYGYFQNCELLEPIRRELCNVFSVTNKSPTLNHYLKIIKNDSILVSVRVLSEAESKQPSKENRLNGKDFFQKGVAMLSKDKKRQIIVLSNDIKTIQKEEWFNSCSSDVVYVDGCTATEQIEIMKHCKDFVISNSSFSWWGSYLGSFINDGTVIAPKIWYGGDDISETKLMFKQMVILDM